MSGGKVDVLDETKHTLVLHVVLPDGRCIIVSVGTNGQASVVESVTGAYIK